MVSLDHLTRSMRQLLPIVDSLVGRAAREWMNRAAVTEPLTQDGIFLAA